MGCTGRILEDLRGISDPVSYTHLDVYKRQTRGREEQKQNAFCPNMIRGKKLWEERDLKFGIQ